MKNIWKIVAWVFILCGISAYLVGWAALFTETVFWNIPNEFWFYDAVVTGIFGIFFLIYSVHSDKEKKR